MAAPNAAELLARLRLLARNEREASVDLVAHLAVLDTRPVLYAADGYGSLFGYCTPALRLSEDAACNRIEAARACRRFPQILKMLSSGALSLTSIRLLGRHLTQENHERVLAKAGNRSRREIEALVSELAPRPDVPSLVRKLPNATAAAAPTRIEPPVSASTRLAETVPPTAPAPTAAVAAPLTRLAPPPVVRQLAPERYRVQFTLGAEGHARLRKLQALLRREIPNGDPGTIVDRALILLLEEVERRKLGAANRPRPPQIIRPGRRCEERTFLELHHRRPYEHRGEPTVDNIALYCRPHNQYEADLVFGFPEASESRANTPAGTALHPG